MKKVLIIAASSVLGAELARVWRRDKRFEVLTVSRRNADFNLDLINFKDLETLILSEKADFIVNLSASYSTDFYEAFNINFEVSRRLIDAVKKTKYATRIMLIGSAAEYGIVHYEDNPIPETKALKPVTLYGLTKSFQSLLVSTSLMSEASIVAARIFNLLGPGFSDRLFIGKIYRQIEEIKLGMRTEIEVGSLDQMRDYVKIEDAVTQLMTIVTKGSPGEIYHVASGTPKLMRDILEEILKEKELIGVPVKESKKYRESQASSNIIYADLSKTKELIAS